ncbi:MAG: ribonuclease III [Oscillospiraceae bacterium]|jgi:ribonuclease-3
MTDLEERLGYEFSDRGLLEKALTHTSWANEHGLSHIESNERLEFLGDSVLSTIVSKKLYMEHPDYTEGQLTRTRAALVCEKSLAEFAGEIGLGNDIKLGRGEAMGSGRSKPSILSDCFEAVIAAIFLDGGMDEARSFVLSFITEEDPGIDSKSQLQQLVQARGIDLEYRLESEEGPQHARTFTIDAYLDGKFYSRGVGSSKQRAEMSAAAGALSKLSKGRA